MQDCETSASRYFSITRDFSQVGSRHSSYFKLAQNVSHYHRFHRKNRRSTFLVYGKILECGLETEAVKRAPGSTHTTSSRLCYLCEDSRLCQNVSLQTLHRHAKASVAHKELKRGEAAAGGRGRGGGSASLARTS